jgi:membrane fusion protein, multidrug efflux system
LGWRARIISSTSEESNVDHLGNKHAGVVEEEIPISVESQSRAQEPAKDSGRFAQVIHGLREHPVKALMVVLTVLAILGVVGYFVRNAFLYEDTDDAQVDGHVMPLSARISGQISEVHVIEGQVVHAGDVLVTIDPEDYKIAAEQAQANLADALATAASSYWNVPITRHCPK